MPIYICPSEIDATELDRPESGPGASLLYRRGSYRCMEGRTDGTGWWDGSSMTGFPREWRGVMHNVGLSGLGTESIRHIKDGTSTTLMVGEMASVSHPRRRTFWAYSYTSYNASAAVAETRTILGDFDRCVAVGGINGSNPCKRGWGSYHADGFAFSMCDGSVRFINNHIDIQIFCDLASIDGSEPIRW